MKFDKTLFILLLILPIHLGSEEQFKRCCPTCRETRVFVWDAKRLAYQCPVCKKHSWINTEQLNKKFNLNCECKQK